MVIFINYLDYLSYLLDVKLYIEAALVERHNRNIRKLNCACIVGEHMILIIKVGQSSDRLHRGLRITEIF